MKTYLTLAAAAASLMIAGAPAQAQTKLKWAHVYETSEPFHTESVWAADEFKKRTNGKYEVTVYPASQLGKETDINQGLTLGTVDIIISGSSFAARAYPPIGVTYYPFTFRGPEHLLAYTKSDIYGEMVKGYQEKSGHQIVTCRPISPCRAPAAPIRRPSRSRRCISRCRMAPSRRRRTR